MRYVKKPVEVEAHQFDGTHESASQIVHWVLRSGGLAYYSTTDMTAGRVVIRTLEGEMEAPEGWWIIRGVEGEFYPCRDDIFHKTYDQVNP